MISYRFVPISSQKGILFFETPGTVQNMCNIWRGRGVSNQIKSNQIKSNQIKSNQIKSNQIKSNQIKSNQIKSNQIKSNRNHYLKFV